MNMQTTVNAECDPNGRTPRLGLPPEIASTVADLLAELHRIAADRYDDIDAKSAAYFGADKPTPEATRAYAKAVGEMLYSFGYFHCFAWLSKVAPDQAQKYVEDRRTALEAGDGFGEWLWQSGEEIVTGKPLTIAGWGLA
jgi:hypothetical protein